MSRTRYSYSSSSSLSSSSSSNLLHSNTLLGFSTTFSLSSKSLSFLFLSLLTSLIPSSCSAAYFFLHEGQTKTFVRNIPYEHQVLSVRWNVSEGRSTSCKFDFKDSENVIRYTKIIEPDNKDQAITNMHHGVSDTTLGDGTVVAPNVGSNSDSGWAAYLSQTYGEHKIVLSCGKQTNWWSSRSQDSMYRWTVIVETVLPSENGEGNLIGGVSGGSNYNNNNYYRHHDHNGGSDAVEDRKYGIVSSKFSNMEWNLRQTAEKLEHMIHESEYEKKEQNVFSEASERTLITITLLKMAMLTIIAMSVWYQIYSMRLFFKQQKLI